MEVEGTNPARGMEFINLTPHPINIVMEDGSVKIVPPSGTIARCRETVSVVGDLDGVPVIKKSFGAIEGLPDPSNEVIYITSALVATAAQRPDVVCPGDPVRDGNGQIIGCKSLCRVI